jgi:hypothetical protein
MPDLYLLSELKNGGITQPTRDGQVLLIVQVGGSLVEQLVRLLQSGSLLLRVGFADAAPNGVPSSVGLADAQ